MGGEVESLLRAEIEIGAELNEEGEKGMVVRIVPVKK